MSELVETPLMEKKEKDDSRVYADDGLDREIQRAIAQHDLQRLQNQDPDLEQTNEQYEEKHGDGNLQENLDEHLEPKELLEEQSDLELGKEFGQELQNHQEHQANHEVHEIHDHDNQSHNLLENQILEVDEKQHLQMIADELKKATTNDKPENVHIPADSELLATNTAFAAYNALSSQVPPVALLTNVHLAALPLPIVAADYLPSRIQVLISTLPVLDNLASQLLRVFVAGPSQKIIDLATSPDTAAGAVFRDVISLFEFTKRLYSEEDPFLTVEHLAPGMWKEGDKTPSMFRSREQSIESTLRKVNLATFLAACLGTIDVGFFYLNELFLEIFCPANNLDPANSMSNMAASNMSLQSGVNTVIGDKVGKLLKPQAILYLELKTQAYISALEAKERTSEEILEDIFPANLEEKLLDRRGVKTLSPTEVDFISRCISRRETLASYDGPSLGIEYEWFSFLKDLFDYISKSMGFLIWGKKGKGPKTTPSSHTPHSDEVLETTVPETVVETATSQEIDDITSALLPSEIQEQQIHLRINPRMQGKVTSRRPWTREEEKALRHALELKGPLWSTILELFGQGGRINESLKNRTQVQLKDKARNWKMFFLKLGLPVPAYLQKVTGDLERDDKLRAKNARNRKTAAAPVPTVKRTDPEPEESEKYVEEPKQKRRRN